MNRGSLLPLRPTFSATLSTALAAFALVGGGCGDLERFTTAKPEAYCGAITLGGFFRTGFSPRVQMRLRLDASQIDGASPAGTLSTYEAAVSGLPEQRLLDEVPLRHVPALGDDPISHLEFGEGRLRNAMFAVTPSATDGGVPGESILAVVSLKSDDSVEVRLIRPGAAPVGDAPVPSGHGPLFGLFPLTRQVVGSCGF